MNKFTAVVFLRFECLKIYYEYTFVTELENAQPAEKYKL